MTIREYVRVLRRNWVLVLAGLVLGGLAAGGLSYSVTPLYRADTRLFVSAQSAQTNADLMQGGSFTQQRMQSYADVARSPRVLNGVISDLRLDEDASDLAERVSAQSPPDTVMLVVSVTDPSAERSARIADAAANSLAETIADLEKPANGPSPVRATIVQPAQVPHSPVSPNTSRNIVIGALLGLLLGVGLALLRQSLDTKIRTAEDVKKVTPATLLGTVPFDKAAADHALVVQDDPHGVRAESLRQVRTNLQFVDATTQLKSVLVTSCLPGEGKSSTSANLAITLAEAGQKVCVIEADLRRPKVVDYLGLEGAAGLTTVLIGEAELEDVVQPWAGVSVGSVDVLATGPLPPNPSELLGSAGMRVVLEELEERYDLVVIDAPPLLPVTDASVLATIADGVILIVGSGRVDARGLAKGLENLETVEAKLLGVVMNRVPITRHSSYYGYGSDYKGKYSSAGQSSAGTLSEPIQPINTVLPKTSAGPPQQRQRTVFGRRV